MTAAPRTARYYQELHRLQFHFSPARNWLNDPNGLVYFEGEYHLFYQYNPEGNLWGHMSWGHAVSVDLVHWTELDVAIPEDAQYMIFSGCIVVDHHNRSGFGVNNRPPLVAIYTGAAQQEGGIQNQQLAYSNDHGRSWIKYANNPVLDEHLQHFRDPKVFWYAPQHKWVMVVALSDVKKVSFYESHDLKHWTHLSDFGPAGSVVDLWECPDLFELPLEDHPDERRWVLKVDDFRGAPAGGGSGGQVFIGEFDGRQFTLSQAKDAVQWLDHGLDFYAAASWSNIPVQDGRCLWLAWMNNHQYAQRTPMAPWRGAMSLPRRVTLRSHANGCRLLQTPAQELETLRVAHDQRSQCLITNQQLSLAPIITHGQGLEILAEFHIGDAQEFGLKVHVGSDQETVIGYDTRTQAVFVDRSRSGVIDFHPGFTGRRSAPLDPVQGVIKLHVFVDAGSIEVFANEGECVLTELLFPGPGDAAFVYVQGGSTTLLTLDVWRLKSIWT